MALCCLIFIFITLSVANCVEMGQPPNATVSYKLIRRNLSNQTIDAKNLTNLNYIKEKPFKVLIHAYNDTPDEFYIQDWTREYLIKDDLNIIQVNWSILANQSILISVENTFFVGSKIGDMLISMNRTLNISFEDFHLIGSSLGSQVAAFTGKRVQNQTGLSIGRLTGVDPAGPVYEWWPPEMRFTKNDAIFVDVIHTDWGFIGIDYIGGDADFFANGGYGPQPACWSLFSFITKYLTNCSHRVAVRYFTESINSHNFIGTKCDIRKKFPFIYLSNYTSYEFGFCKNYPTALMGENCDPKTARGSYYLDTNAKPPYAKGEHM